MIPAKPFYMLRHGQSEANASVIVAGGELDSPLNHIGIGQAHDLAQVVDQLEVKPDIIYQSGMKRAHKTAEIVNTHLGLEMIEDNNMRERDMGEWSGKHWPDIKDLINLDNQPKGGECSNMFRQRVQVTMTDILNKEDRLVMFVCHGGVFHALGMLYEYGMSSIQNCHLHYFKPCADYQEFPWKVSHFDVEGPSLVQRPAQFCLSQALSKTG